MQFRLLAATSVRLDSVAREALAGENVVRVASDSGRGEASRRN
jgi:hypothetical protein